MESTHRLYFLIIVLITVTIYQYYIYNNPIVFQIDFIYKLLFYIKEISPQAMYNYIVSKSRHILFFTMVLCITVYLKRYNDEWELKNCKENNCILHKHKTK